MYFYTLRAAPVQPHHPYQEFVAKQQEQGCDEVVLETEQSNTAALGLYTKLGFVRDKKLER